MRAMVRRAVPLLLVLAVTCAAHADPGETHVPARPGRSASLSTGSPSSGRLVAGVELRETPHLRRVTGYRRSPNRWATEELIGLLERAAARVAQRIPGSRVSVGDLSGPAGGPLPFHRSHQSGRDVDIAPFMLDRSGAPVEALRFVSFADDGLGEVPFRNLRFDDPRNWELVTALVEDPDTRVQSIFVNAGLERRLLAEGRSRGASPALVERVRIVVSQPHVRHPHRNHFHVRIECPPDDRRSCTDRRR